MKSIFSVFCIIIIFALISTFYFNGYISSDGFNTDSEDLVLGSDDINFPYTRETLFTKPMEAFDTYYIYPIKEPPRKSMTEYQKEYFREVVRKTSNKFNLKKSDFDHGNYRLTKNGVELNLYFSGDQKRISVFQPLASTLHMREISIPLTQKVNIILPLKGKLSPLAVFLDNLVEKILPVENNIALTVVYFNDESMTTARKLIKSKLNSVPFFEWRFVPTNSSHFSRGKGIRIGIEAAAKNPSDLLFICDVDVLVNPTFFSRCRANTILEHQVYFPVLFSLYNPNLVYALHEKSTPHILDQLVVKNDNGYWRFFGFGMFCMYEREYAFVKGIDELKTWGKEDQLFYQKFSDQPSIKVIRPLDDSIFHVYHPKNCSEVKGVAYPDCLMSKVASEGAQSHLGLYLFKQKEGVDVEGILSRSYYYFTLVPVLAALDCFLMVVVGYLWYLLRRRKY